MKAPISLRLLAAAWMLALLPGCGKKAAPDLPTPPAASPTPQARIASAEPTAFETVTRQLDPGGWAYCYLSTEDLIRWGTGYFGALKPVVMQGVMAKMDPMQKVHTEAIANFIAHFVAQSGLKDISGFGYSSIALEPGFYQAKTVLARDPAKPAGLLWKISSPTPNALDFTGYLPANTTLAIGGNTKLLPVWEELNRQTADQPEAKAYFNLGAQSFQMATGLDLAAFLASLGPNFSLLLTLTPERPVTIPAGQGKPPLTIAEPAFAYWVQVQNDLLINKLEEALSKNSFAVKAEVEGWTVYNLNFPAVVIMAPWVHPAVAWRQGTVALFSNSALLSEMLAVKAGKKPGLAADPGFTKLRKGLPENGSAFAYAAPSFQKTIRQIQDQVNASADPVAKAMMEKIESLNRNYSILSVKTETPAGSISIAHQQAVP